MRKLALSPNALLSIIMENKQLVLGFLIHFIPLAGFVSRTYRANYSNFSGKALSIHRTAKQNISSHEKKTILAIRRYITSRRVKYASLLRLPKCLRQSYTLFLNWRGLGSFSVEIVWSPVILIWTTKVCQSIGIVRTKRWAWPFLR